MVVGSGCYRRTGDSRSRGTCVGRGEGLAQGWEEEERRQEGGKKRARRRWGFQVWVERRGFTLKVKPLADAKLEAFTGFLSCL